MAEKKEEKKKEKLDKKEAKEQAKIKEDAKKEKKEAKIRKDSGKEKKIKSVELPKPTDASVAEAFEVIKFVLMTEKSVRAIEAQNKLVFIARRNARRDEIRKAVETAFGSPVSGVTTMIDQSGRKKAFVRFTQPGAAGDIAIKLGII